METRVRVIVHVFPGVCGCIGSGTGLLAAVGLRWLFIGLSDCR